MISSLSYEFFEIVLFYFWLIEVFLESIISNF